MDGEPLAAREEVPRSGESAEPVERWFRAFLRDTESAAGETLPPLRAWVDLAEAWRIIQALQAARGNRSAAARTLGIGRRTLYAKMERLGIEAAWSAAGSTRSTRPSPVRDSQSAQ
jgi:DNA-binding NtrC family response regulator